MLVDSNIFLDHYLDRKDNLLPLGDFAFEFFKNAVSCKYVVLITRDVVFEIGNVLGFSQKEVWENVFDLLSTKHKIELLEYSFEFTQKARVLAFKERIPKTDALLIELAKHYNYAVVSRNFHFDFARKFVDIFKPEEL